jgi:hypothetical protein
MSTTKQLIDDGGTAFPTADTIYPNGQMQFGSNGMSLRDWFAGMAMQGMLSNPELSGSVELLARESFTYADAMIAEQKGGSHE